MAPAQSFVCSVLSTKCPVSAACTAICAVATSRISPIMMMSGSCRRIERSADAERQLPRFVDLHLVHQLDLVLDRILDRHHVAVYVLDQLERRIKRRRLAATRRAGDEHQSVRLRQQAA